MQEQEANGRNQDAGGRRWDAPKGANQCLLIFLFHSLPLNKTTASCLLPPASCLLLFWLFRFRRASAETRR